MTTLKMVRFMALLLVSVVSVAALHRGEPSVESGDEEMDARRRHRRSERARVQMGAGIDGGDAVTQGGLGPIQRDDTETSEKDTARERNLAASFPGRTPVSLGAAAAGQIIRARGFLTAIRWSAVARRRRFATCARPRYHAAAQSRRASLQQKRRLRQEWTRRDEERDH
jgi:hypothetical protein